MVYKFTQFWHVLTIKTAILISAIILAVAINPDWNVHYPWDIKTIYYSMIIGVIVVTTIVEIKFTMIDRGISGITGFSALGIVFLIIGIGILIYILGLGYNLSDPNVNRWIAWYMIIGSVILFAQAREELLHFRKIRRLLSGQEK